jgi:hypothetical protein
MYVAVHLAWAGFELTTLVVIGTDYMGNYKSNYHMITATTTCVLKTAQYNWNIVESGVKYHNPILIPWC